MNKNEIFGVKFNDFTDKNEFLQLIVEELIIAKSCHQSKLIAHLNVHGLNLAYTDKKYTRLLNSADVLFVDSIGLKIVANLFLKSKVSFASTPPEWMHEFFKLVPAGTKFFFIGDEPEVIQDYNSIFYTSFPQLKAVGYHDGFFLQDPAVEEKLLTQIKNCSPDILIVGMGMPIQEFWIERIRHKVFVPMFIPVGAYYQRMTGKQKRPSRFISSIGMEWLHRLIMNPQGLFKRYLIGNFTFVYRIIKYRLQSWRNSGSGKYIRCQKTVTIIPDCAVVHHRIGKHSSNKRCSQ